ncbi:trafficking protein particle complex subunit 6b [Anaeramoeba flamelloides]|uniref:Trafficking protein particle complex subunit 6b n=1 Tax=Anaeramoeba flamelloides TaxID=1746091 RepID=A0AAV7ZEN3_9EUKA|nr:trafficking protein particle complex subunit 6b [Anaeramoeba flamelloides]
MAVAYTSFEFLYFEYTKYILGSTSLFDQSLKRNNSNSKNFQQSKKEEEEEEEEEEKKKKKKKSKKKKEKKFINLDDKYLLNYLESLFISQQKLINVGFRIGRRLVEKYSIEVPRLVGDESKLKYIAKNFWKKLFGKAINSLRTNNNGTWVLQDIEFKLLSHLSFPKTKKKSDHKSTYPGGMERFPRFSQNSFSFSSNWDESTKEPNEFKKKDLSSTKNKTRNSSKLPSFQFNKHTKKIKKTIEKEKKFEQEQQLDNKAALNSEKKEFLQRYLSLFIGILQGAISNLGIQCKVSVVCNKLPICIFTINKIPLNPQSRYLQEKTESSKN